MKRENENLSWFNGPMSHVHLKLPNEKNMEIEGGDSFQFSQETAPLYVAMLSGRSNIRITDTNHAMLSFGNLDTLRRPDTVDIDTWRDGLIEQASEATLKRIANIKDVSGPNIIVGIEADIVGSKGELSLNEECLDQIDFTIASFHRFIWTLFSERKEFSPDELIHLYLGALDNPHVKVLGHPTRVSSRITRPLTLNDFLPVIQKLKEKRVAYEVNVLVDLSDEEEQLNREIIQACLENKVPIIVSTDFHHLQQIDFLKDLHIQDEVDVHDLHTLFTQNRTVHYRVLRRLIKNIDVLKSLGATKDRIVNSSDQNFNQWLSSFKQNLPD